ncbi:hypothetical protein Vafri_7323 [Volvox africanus]|uniref:CCHC-type domain-containing protein n=1 Tax=Volvox africanus TaxID=51714 RepID=A0A8J4B0K2_9CHLO|nr:hypothetical protein Vafri_7323 [Volvox africanus]
MPRVVKHNLSLDESEDEHIDESSSSDEEVDVDEQLDDDEEQEDSEEGDNETADAAERGKTNKTAVTSGTGQAAEVVSQRQPEAPGRLKLSLGGKNDVCKVCGKRGHKAGFVGATYMDCPNRPCYLCKLVGHTTATCPYRIAPGHGCTAASDAATRGSLGRRGSLRGWNLCAALQSRECSGSRQPLGPRRCAVPRYQVEAAILKIHSRRCCTLEFHPTNDSIVVSGDKKGGLAVWNFDQVHDRTVYDTVHSCLTNSIRFLPWVDSMTAVTASSDGTAKLVDLETGDWRPLLDLNPGGWVQVRVREREEWRGGWEKHTTRGSQEHGSSLHLVKAVNSHTHMHTYAHIDAQTDRHTDRHTQTDAQTDAHRAPSLFEGFLPSRWRRCHFFGCFLNLVKPAK